MSNRRTAIIYSRTSSYRAAARQLWSTLAVIGAGIGMTVGAFALSGCGGIPVASEVQALPISKLPSSKAGAALGEAVEFKLPVKKGKTDLPGIVSSVTVEELAIRSVLADDEDRTVDARKDEERIYTCAGDREGLGFIESATILIKHPDEDDDKAVAIATYTRAEGANPCGFFMEPIEGVDIKDYVENYAMVAKGKGIPQAKKIEVSGYIKLAVKAGF